MPDFRDNFSHQCNSLASYEQKRNPNPSKKETELNRLLEQSGSTTSAMIKSKAIYQKQKDHATSIADLKKFSKPNLDDGNRYFDDNLNLRNKFSRFEHPVSEVKTKQEYSKERPQAASYRGERNVAAKGYTPKLYAGRPVTAAYLNYVQNKLERKNEKQ